MATTIEVRGVRKSFGPTLALDGMSFTVRPGFLTGFVGPGHFLGLAVSDTYAFGAEAFQKPGSQYDGTSTAQKQVLAGPS